MRYWMLAGIIVVTFLFQSVTAVYLAVAGVMPDLLLVMVVTFGLLFGWEVGLGGGVLAGLLMDLTASRFIGLHVLALGVAGLAAGIAEENVFKDNILLAPAAGFFSSMGTQMIVLAVLWLYGWQVSLIESLRSVIFPAALYDMAVAILVYNRVYKYYLYLRPSPRGTIEIRRS